jgi:type I restriction enzyme S subunit
MSFPRYPEYKDSGVEWLGDVPGHWVVTALKRGFEVTLGKMLQPDSTGPNDELLHYLRAANIQWDGVDSTDVKQMWFSKRDRAQLCLVRGDLLVSEGGDVGRSCIWASELEICYFQNSVNRVRARDGHSNRYLYYWISTVKDKGYIDVLCNKSTIAHFTAEKVAAVPIPLPAPSEQTQIAAFLDRETAKIDALVAEQRRLMALLKEKRQAVISHAVTMGLNPNTPMKPSGIEWLGDVPGHWSLPKLKDVASFSGGGTPSRENLTYWNGDIPWVSPKDMKAERIVGAEECITDSGLRNSSSKLLPTGRVLIVVRSGILQHTIPVAINQVSVALNQDMKALEFDDKRVIAEFFMRWVQGLNDLLLLAWAKQGATVESIEQSYLANTIVPMPNVAEQAMIIGYLRLELAKFDTLTTEAQRAIDLLQERRTALISAAVTGQIDVRGAV